MIMLIRIKAMTKLMKKFDVQKYNKEIIMLNQQLDSLNNSLRYLKEWGNIEITDEFLEEFLQKPEVILDRYLSYKHISKEIFSSHNIKSNDYDNPSYGECEETIIELMSIARTTKTNLYKLLGFISSELGHTFTIKNGVATKTDNAEYYIMRGCSTFTKNENEEHVLTCLQGICNEMDKLKDCNISIFSLYDLIDKVDNNHIVSNKEFDNLK